MFLERRKNQKELTDFISCYGTIALPSLSCPPPLHRVSQKTDCPSIKSPQSPLNNGTDTQWTLLFLLLLLLLLLLFFIGPRDCFEKRQEGDISLGKRRERGKKIFGTIPVPDEEERKRNKENTLGKEEEEERRS